MYCLFPHILLQHQLSSSVQYNLFSLSQTHTPLSPFIILLSHLFLLLFPIIHPLKSLIPHSHFFPSYILQPLYNFSLTQLLFQHSPSYSPFSNLLSILFKLFNLNYYSFLSYSIFQWLITPFSFSNSILLILFLTDIQSIYTPLYLLFNHLLFHLILKDVKTHCLLHTAVRLMQGKDRDTKGSWWR